LRGQLWLSLFYAARPGAERGLVAAGWVSYEAGSTLEYAELFVGRPLKVDDTRRVTVDHMWVDSPASLEGGRSIWGMPKAPATFALDRGGLGPVGRAAWAATVEGAPIASASFADVNAVAPRVPVRTSTWQTREDGSQAVGRARGTARSLPCLGHWDFDMDGPLGWLHDQQPVASFRVRDFDVTYS
jgi:acetoacetate decarboxylase